MTRAQAAEIAANLYPAHADAAELLILQATATDPSETRTRAAIALRCLDPDEPLPFAELPGGAAFEAAQAIGFLLVANISGTREDRRRVAGLLGQLCREAAQLAERERAA
jgi:hypothetical protein